MLISKSKRSFCSGVRLDTHFALSQDLEIAAGLVLLGCVGAAPATPLFSLLALGESRGFAFLKKDVIVAFPERFMMKRVGGDRGAVNYHLWRRV